MLYHVRILEDLGEISEALALLDTCAKSRAIVDLTAILEYRGESTVYPSTRSINQNQLGCTRNLVLAMPNLLGGLF